MSDETTSKSGKTWIYVTGVFVSLPLLYALSIGPAYVLVERSVINQGVFETAFSPLEHFARTTDSGESFRAYIRTWLVLTNTPVPKWLTR